MSWAPRKLDELGEVSRGRSRHRPRDAAHLYGGPYPFIQTGDVKHAGLYVTEHSQTYSDAGLEQSKLWPVGTLCITIAANIAETAILSYESCFPDSVIGFIPDPDKANTKFIKYYFDAILKGRYKQFSQGAAQDNLSQEKLLSLDFFVPDVDEQARVAEKISVFDDLIENNCRRIALLEESAQLLYREWFLHLRFPGHEHVKVVDGVPEAWRRTTVGAEVDFLSRGIAPTYDDEADGVVINQKCIRNHVLDLIKARRQSKEVPQAKFVIPGDILVNSTGEGTLGRVAQVIVDVPNCTVDSHVTIVRPSARIGRYYLGQCFIAVEDQLATMGRGATNQTELSRQDIAALELLLPTKEIISPFEESVDLLYRQIVALMEKSKKLGEARDLLLPRLMSGKIKV